MKTLGWKSVLYAAIVLVPNTAVIVYSASIDRNIDIDQGFYVAAAQIIPILLFAQVFRLNSVHRWVFKGGERLGQILETTVTRVEAVRAKAMQEEADETLLREIDELEDEMAPLQANTSSGLHEAETVIQLLYGCALATWVVAIAGGAAVLTDLAMQSDSLAIFVTTVLAVMWLTISLLVFELLLLTLPHTATPSDETR